MAGIGGGGGPPRPWASTPIESEAGANAPATGNMVLMVSIKQAPVVYHTRCWDILTPLWHTYFVVARRWGFWARVRSHYARLGPRMRRYASPRSITWSFWCRTWRSRPRSMRESLA